MIWLDYEVIVWSHVASIQKMVITFLQDLNGVWRIQYRWTDWTENQKETQHFKSQKGGIIVDGSYS